MADIEDRGVFLCSCNGKVSAGLPLYELRAFLETAQPGLRVVIADNICQTPVLRDLMREHEMRPSVIGGCAQLKSGLGFWEDPESCVLDRDTVGLVDLAREANSPYSPWDRQVRVKALLWAKVKRQEKFDGVPQKARRVHFATPQGEVTRRDLLQSVLPKYRVMPYIDVKKCAGERCRICRQGCPGDAISIEARQPSIDVLRCKGCGSCSSVCPCQAVIYPNYSLEQLEAELAGLLLDDDADLGARVIAFTCRSASQYLDTTGEHVSLPSSVFLVEVPCLAMIPAWLMLRAFELGAEGVALVAHEEKCQLKVKESIWLGTAEFVRGVLLETGVGPDRLRIAEGANLTSELRQLGDAVCAWPPRPRRLVQQEGVPPESPVGASVILRLAAQVGGSLGGTVSSGKVPFGKVTLDDRRCTACGICVPECPVEALTSVSDKDLFKIVFRQASCVGCGQCGEICPEKCLKVDKVLELATLGGKPEVILEGDFIQCIWCGAPFAPRPMFEKLRSRIAAAGGNISQLERCPDCRMKGRAPGAKTGRAGV